MLIYLISMGLGMTMGHHQSSLQIMELGCYKLCFQINVIFMKNIIASLFRGDGTWEEGGAK